MERRKKFAIDERGRHLWVYFSHDMTPRFDDVQPRRGGVDSDGCEVFASPTGIVVSEREATSKHHCGW